MSDTVFRVILPLFWLALIVGVAANRWQVRRRLRHDPIVIRPWQETKTPTGYLERALSICTLLLTADIVLNAIWPEVMADTLAVNALRSSREIGYLGLLLLTIGFFLAAVGVRQMGVSWRIGIDNQAPGPLVSRGLFSRVRHPIYGGMLLAIAGIAGVTADVFSIAVAAAAWIGIPVQARLEEAFLLSQHPQEYPSYLAHTGRFWPRIR